MYRIYRHDRQTPFVFFEFIGSTKLHLPEISDEFATFTERRHQPTY